MWMTFIKPSNQNDVELCIQFLINNGVPTDDVKCFDQHSQLKKCMEICLNDEESTTLIALQKWIRYFENSYLLKI